MSIQRTLSIIKPDAIGRDQIGEILQRFEQEGLRIVAARMLRLSRKRAEQFYAVHKDKPFYSALVEFMTSDAVMVQVLEGEDAVVRHRDLIGATDPGDAAPHTIRSHFATDLERNAVHGSDSAATAAEEIAFFFSDEDLRARTDPPQ